MNKTGVRTTTLIVRNHT